MRRLAVALALALVLLPVRDGPSLVLAAPSADGQGYGPARQSQRPPELKLTSTLPRRSGPSSDVRELVQKLERLSPNPAGAARMKEAAERASRGLRGRSSDSPSLESALGAARAASATTALSPAPRGSLESGLTTSGRGPQGDVVAAGVPTTIISSLGQSDTDFAPSDAVIAAGTTRYIQLVNSKFGIYAYTSGTPIGQGTLDQLTNAGIGQAYAPQIIWDPDTNRFYYSTAVTVLESENYLAFGFSKTATPMSGDDFCHYFLPTLDRFLNVTSLGDTQNRVLIGNESYNLETTAFLRTDLTVIPKPPAGSTCPASTSFEVGAFENLKNTDAEPVFSVAAANQIDGSTIGFAVATSRNVLEQAVSALTIYKIEEDGVDTFLSFADLPVPTYAVPANAEQPGTTNRLFTGFGGPTQAVSAIDPTRGDVVGLWTQHTVFGGAGASVRWYEIDAAAPSLLQARAIAAPSAYLFNAAISPDRIAVGATRRFGGNMGLGLNASATNLKASIITASKVGSGEIGYKFVAQSPAVLNDFSCMDEVCLWGNRAGAAPAPINVPSWTQGLIAHTTNFVLTSGSTESFGWGSLNMYIVPQ
jgi:hypothetical protein